MPTKSTDEIISSSLNRVKLEAQKLLSFGSEQSEDIDRDELRKALTYIDGYWKQITHKTPKDTGTLIGLPNPYTVPSVGQQGFVFEEQYYWDSYFTALGLVNTKYQALAEGMLENLLYLLDRFGRVPNGSRYYLMSRSQPPVLTSFIWLIYESGNKSVEWLKLHMAKAETEYWNVWRSSKHPSWHEMYKGLSRYYDVGVLHDLAEAESGWDMTPRFSRRAMDFLPVDLNSMLYKYEIDFAKAAQICGDDAAAKDWLKRARVRKKQMMELMWDSSSGFFYDFDHAYMQRGGIRSLAGYFPMWAGMLSGKEAARIMRQLQKFEHDGGLATTHRYLPLPEKVPTQWAYPNGWAPLQYVAVESFKKYNYTKDAERIALKWLKTNLEWFTKHGVFLEKYNVVKPQKPPTDGLYPTQTGFGWTNAIFVHLAREYLGEYIP